MFMWKREVTVTSPEEVEEFCVGDEDWQAFRRTMKGMPTTVKLEMLDRWFLKNVIEKPRRTQVQVDNYLKALKRGGQLGMNLEVRR